MQVGDTFEAKRLLRQEDFNRFARLSGDDNPIHVDPEFSARTKFGKTVAHGMYLYSLISGLLEEHLPGARPMSQELIFPAPSYAGEEITIRLRVEYIDEQETITDVETTVTRPTGEVGCRGKCRLRLG